MENEKSNVIVSISAQDIYQHPDNPRKDLGDLSELSDSIAKKGIMQNLTVIPGHWDEDRNWHEDGYTLIIGHRRFAAAKQAGIQELPCRVVEDMDKKPGIYHAGREHAAHRSDYLGTGKRFSDDA